MAVSEDFRGTNAILKGPPDGNVEDLRVFRNGLCVVSKWRLSEDEIAEIANTGCIFLCVMSGDTSPPVFVGSEESVRSVASDYGAWRK